MASPALQSALGLLAAGNPSDEAVFAALAIIAKKVSANEFHARKRDILRAMNGDAFVLRAFATKGMERLGLNILSAFCADDALAAEFNACAAHVGPLLEELLGEPEGDVNAIHDALLCLGALPSSGRELCAAALALTPSEPLQCAALDALAKGRAAQLHHGDAIVELYTRGMPVALSLSAGRALVSMAASLTQAQAQRLLEHASKVLQSSSSGGRTPPEQRALAMSVAATVLSTVAGVTIAQPQALVLATAASVELDVGLARVASSVVEKDDAGAIEQSRTTEDAAVLVDIVLGRARALDEFDDDAAMGLLHAAERVLASCCAFASRVHGRAGAPATLCALAMSALAACLTLYWADDAVSRSGLRLASDRCKFPLVAVACLDLAGPSARFLIPVVAALGLHASLLPASASATLQRVARDWLAQQQHGEWAAAFYHGNLVVAALDSLGGPSPALHDFAASLGDVAASLLCVEHPRDSVDGVCAWACALAFAGLLALPQASRAQVASCVQELQSRRFSALLGDDGEDDGDVVPPTHCGPRNAKWALAMLQSLL